jgi:hypothetical protein
MPPPAIVLLHPWNLDFETVSVEPSAHTPPPCSFCSEWKVVSETLMLACPRARIAPPIAAPAVSPSTKTTSSPTAAAASATM